MEIIKLYSIDSTNDFLKSYNRSHSLKNFTVVSAQNQIKGRGQRQNKWFSEPGKNLTFSILVQNILHFQLDIYILNLLTSIMVSDFINSKLNAASKVKWPNDIYIRNNKVAGILIEFIHKNNQSIDAIVGIGININQTHFPSSKNSTSIALETNSLFDIDLLLNEFVEKFESTTLKFKQDTASQLLINYNNRLFKKDTPAVFKTTDNKQFMGVIKEVTADGKIHIMNEDDSIQSYESGAIQLIIPS